MEPKFKSGDFLKQIGESYKYYVIVEQVKNGKYLIYHTFVLEQEKRICYSKNTGHDAWMGCKEIEKQFTKIGYIPSLVNQKTVIINK